MKTSEDNSIQFCTSADNNKLFTKEVWIDKLV